MGAQTGKIVGGATALGVGTGCAAHWLGTYSTYLHGVAGARLAVVPPRFSHPALAELVAEELRIPALGVAIAGGTAAMGMSFALHEYLFPSEPTDAAAAGNYLVMQANGSRHDKAPKMSHVVPTPSQAKAINDSTAQANAQKSAAGAATLAAGMGTRRRTTPDWMGHQSGKEKRQAAEAAQRERERWGDDQAPGFHALPPRSRSDEGVAKRFSHREK